MSAHRLGNFAEFTFKKSPAADTGVIAGGEGGAAMRETSVGFWFGEEVGDADFLF